ELWLTADAASEQPPHPPSHAGPRAGAADTIGFWHGASLCDAVVTAVEERDTDEGDAQFGTRLLGMLDEWRRRLPEAAAARLARPPAAAAAAGDGVRLYCLFHGFRCLGLLPSAARFLRGLVAVAAKPEGGGGSSDVGAGVGGEAGGREAFAAAVESASAVAEVLTMAASWRGGGGGNGACLQAFDAALAYAAVHGALVLVLAEQFGARLDAHAAAAAGGDGSGGGGCSGGDIHEAWRAGRRWFPTRRQLRGWLEAYEAALAAFGDAAGLADAPAVLMNGLRGEDAAVFLKDAAEDPSVLLRPPGSPGSPGVEGGREGELGAARAQGGTAGEEDGEGEARAAAASPSSLPLGDAGGRLDPRAVAAAQLGRPTRAVAVHLLSVVRWLGLDVGVGGGGGGGEASHIAEGPTAATYSVSDDGDPAAPSAWHTVVLADPRRARAAAAAASEAVPAKHATAAAAIVVAAPAACSEDATELAAVRAVLAQHAGWLAAVK
ncbi:hypothetical protein HK405_005101, partial [Cladochytrium tenue]